MKRVEWLQQELGRTQNALLQTQEDARVMAVEVLRLRTAIAAYDQEAKRRAEAVELELQRLREIAAKSGRFK